MKQFFTLLAAAILIAGCTKFEIDDDQWPVVKSGKISAQEFRENIIGHGWNSGLTYRIVNGRVTKEVLDELAGFRSGDYYFDENTVTTFISPDHIPVSGYYVRTFKYNESDCSIYINGYKSMTIVNLTKNKFEAIRHTGTKSDGTKSFGYVTYTRMSEEEIADTRKNYSTDLDTVD